MNSPGTTEFKREKPNLVTRPDHWIMGVLPSKREKEQMQLALALKDSLKKELLACLSSTLRSKE